MNEEQTTGQPVWTKTGQWEGEECTAVDTVLADCLDLVCRECYRVLCPWRTETSELEEGGGQK